MKTIRRSLAVTFLLGMLVATVAHAAEVIVLAEEDDTERPAVILLQGKILADDDVVFEQKVAPMRRAIVFLEGPGGHEWASLNIGMTIRRRAFRTAVADRARCSSGCAMAWLGGVIRYIGDGARVGFHAASPWQGSREVSASGDARMGSYLATLGYPDRTVDFVISTPPRQSRT